MVEKRDPNNGDQMEKLKPFEKISLMFFILSYLQVGYVSMNVLHPLQTLTNRFYYLQQSS